MGAEVGALARLGAPLVLAQLAIVGMGAIDTALAGRIDRATLGGVAVGTAVWGILLLLMIGTLIASSTLIAEQKALGQLDRTRVIGQHALRLGGLIALVNLGLIQLTGPLLVAFGVDPEVRPAAIDFLRGIQWGLPALAVYAASRYYCEGMGHTRASMYVALIGLAALYPIARTLMFGADLGPITIPPLKAYGCGLATAITLTLEAIALQIYLRVQRELRQLQPWVWQPLQATEVKRIAVLGLPVAFAILMEASLFHVVTLLMGTLGAKEVGAHQIAINVASLAFMIPFGLAGALAIRVGQARGSGDPAQVRLAVRAGFVLALITQCLSATLIVLLATPIARLYAPTDPELVAGAALLLMYAAIFQLPDGLQVMANGALRGLQDTRIPALLTVVAYWGVGFPLTWWLGLKLGWGPGGLWIGFIGGLSVAALVLGLRLRHTLGVQAPLRAPG